MEVTDQVAAVEKYIEAFEQNSTDLIRELYAVDATVEDPVGTDVREGIEAIVEFYVGAFASGVKLALVGKPRCAGMSVAFSFQVTADDMKIDIIDVFDFNDEGKVAAMKAYWGAENFS